MGRVLAGLGGAFGLAALWRFLRRAPAPEPTGVDPAEELRVRLEQAREAADDRDEFDASEGQPVDEVEQPRSIEERRRAIHDKAQQALGEMHGSEPQRLRKSPLSRLLRGRGILQGMSKLPQADELPHADEGYDPARVEEAFAAFADRVRELESVASELRAELKAVRAERTAPARYDDDEDWPAETRALERRSRAVP